jgi:hypothetical protein
MTDRAECQPFYARGTYRLLTGTFGLFLTGVGLYALFFAGTSTGVRLVGGSVLVLAGCNLVSSAYKAKPSWLSRLGPLP